MVSRVGATLSTMKPLADFSIEALYAALDAQRVARGIAWQQVTREVNALFEHVPSRPISSSTLTGMRSKQAIDGDGVLQMLRWLDRTPESFVPGYERSMPEATPLPSVGRDQILRFDTKALYLALNTQRLEREQTWVTVAREIGGLNAASLSRYENGGRTGFPQIMRITRWLWRPAASFTRAFNR